MSPRIAIVGAGLAGLVCARRLAEAGADVTVFEKSRGPGGRCATRRSDVGPFHHGAPSFGAHSPAFQAEVARWQMAGGVGPCSQPGRWVGLPTMNALARQLATGLDVVAEATVSALVREADAAGGAGPAWRVVVAEAGGGAGGEAARRRFDAVLLAVPAEQAVVLSAASAPLQETLRTVHSEPCWTLMLAWPSGAAPAAPPPLPGDGPLAAIVDCSRLPHTAAPDLPPAGPRWTLHASAAWSRTHLEDTPAMATAALLQALADALSAAHALALPAPLHAVAHRWRFGQVVAPAAAPFGWDAALRLGACGDAWHGAAAAGRKPLEGVERAWLSAVALADALLPSPAVEPSAP